MPDERRSPNVGVDDRGQLLLVGAVAIALIILGLVVVFNTVLFTETQEPTRSLDDAADSNALRTQIVNDTRTLVTTVHNETGFNCSPMTGSLENRVRSNLVGSDSLSSGLTNISAKTGVRYVTVEPPSSGAVASCAGDELRVEYVLVVRTPETDYRTTIDRSYEYNVSS